MFAAFAFKPVNIRVGRIRMLDLETLDRFNLYINF